MRRWIPVILPTILLAAILAGLTLFPHQLDWNNTTWFPKLPYVLLTVSLVLGIAFMQTRISFLCLLLGLTVFLINHHFFVRQQPGAGQSVILLSSIYLPVLTALFYRLPERGIINLHGAIRAAIVASVALVLLLLPRNPSTTAALIARSSALLSPLPSTTGIPSIGIWMLAFSFPFLIVPRQHESPMLGPLLALALLFALGGMSFEARLWRVGPPAIVFTIFMTGAGITLIWAVLESAWRHATIDELTELPGRRAMKHHFRKLGSSFSIAVIDIDHFKRINDRHGHTTGDQVLRFVAAILRSVPAGRTYRYGGEEFVVVCERVTLSAAVDDMAMLCQHIAERPFYLRAKRRPRRKPEEMRGPEKADASKKPIKVTISIGVAEGNDKHPSPDATMVAADKALYRAKKAGRNRVKSSR